MRTWRHYHSTFCMLVCVHMSTFYLYLRFPIILCFSPKGCRAQLRFRMLELDFLGFTGNEKQHSHSSYSVISQSTLHCCQCDFIFIFFLSYSIGPFISAHLTRECMHICLRRFVLYILYVTHFFIQHVANVAYLHPTVIHILKPDGKLIDNKMDSSSLMLLRLG